MAIQITSSNFNGQLADITFYPCTGGTISLGVQVLPYTYNNESYEGLYDLYFSAYNKTCQLNIICPTPTSTPQPTTTPTSTPQPTPTPTPTEPAGYKLQAEDSAFIQAENGDQINIEH